MALPIVLQAAITSQITQQYVSLITSMHTWLRANPTATSAQAVTALNALADPYPSDIVKITDRTGAFNWLAGKVHPYEGKASAYLSLRQLMIDHPVAFIFALDYDSGKIVISKADAWVQRITHADPLTYGSGAVGATYSCTRDPAKGNYVTSETWSATVDGVARAATRTIALTSDGAGGWTSTPGAWAVA